MALPSLTHRLLFLVGALRRGLRHLRVSPAGALTALVLDSIYRDLRTGNSCGRQSWVSLWRRGQTGALSMTGCSFPQAQDLDWTHTSLIHFASPLGNLALGFDAQMLTACCLLCVSNNVLSLWRLVSPFRIPSVVAVPYETLDHTCRTTFPRWTSGVDML